MEGDFFFLRMNKQQSAHNKITAKIEPLHKLLSKARNKSN